MEMDIQIRREEREFQLQMINLLTHNNHSMIPPATPSYPMHYRYGGYYVDELVTLNSY